MKSSITRRHFLNSSAASAAGAYTLWHTSSAFGKDSPNEKLVMGCIGTSRTAKGGNGRGSELAHSFAGLPVSEVAVVCDVDSRNIAPAQATVEEKQGKAPKGVDDFRRVLDDKSIDAVTIATPDHLHTPIALLALQAGKHVYVEKPCCHNPHEGELLIAAAKKHGKQVQHGTQRRSWTGIREGIERLHAGEIGRPVIAKTYYNNNRASIGKGKETEAPTWLNWNLWQGPAPDRPYRDNLVHYNWHWFWHYGTGELANNGVHTIDVARWGLGVDLPQRVSSTGGKYRYPDDDQETPDTNVVSFDFGDRTLTWESRSWATHKPADTTFDIAFFCEKGTLTIYSDIYNMYDLTGKEIGKYERKIAKAGQVAGVGNDIHTLNFANAVRGQDKLNAPIDEGFKSALMCHLGNISYRTGRTIHVDPATGRIKDDADAMKYWKREYRAGWEPSVG